MGPAVTLALWRARDDHRMTRPHSILHRLRVESPSSSSTAGPQSRHEHSEAMSISVASCTIKENRLQLRRGLNRYPKGRLLFAYRELTSRRRKSGEGLRLREHFHRIGNRRLQYASTSKSRATSRFATGGEWSRKASCHQTIVNALAPCGRAAGGKCVDRLNRRLCHRQNLSQRLFSVPLFPSVSCTV